MDNVIFQNNLSALQSRSPDAAKCISGCSLDGFQVEAFKTKSNAVSARVVPEGSDKSILLHSAYDPIREAMRWVENVPITEATNAIVLGTGLGYHLLALIKRHQKNLRYVVVIERDPRIFRLAMMTLDLRSVISHPGTVWLINESPENVPETLADARADMILHNCNIMPHDPSMRCYGAYYNQVREHFLKALTRDEVNLRTSFESQGRNQFNIYMNIPAIFHGHALKDCEGMLNGYPGVVVAAGPSLDKNIDCLSGLDDRAGLFIVDTAQISFRRRGIQPGVIVTADPTPLNFSHFEAIDNLGDAFLAFHPEANRQITQKYLRHPYLLPLFDKDSALLDYLFDVQNIYGQIPRAMNVGHIAFNLARHMGCSPIILVGFDYAFPRGGGATHAMDAALSRRVEKMLEDGTVVIGGKEGKTIEESGTMALVPGYYGDQVPTTVPFQQYIQAIEKTIAECDIDIIDATEGGAYFQGSIRMPLKEALQKSLDKRGVGELFNAYRRQSRTGDFDSVIKKLNEGLEVLKNGRDSCAQMKRMLNEWGELIDKGDISSSEAKERWNAFDKVWLDMVGDPRFEGFMGTTVQPLYFRRQKSIRPQDDSPRAFLACMKTKYDGIITDMDSLLENFLHCIELSIMSLKAVEGKSL